MKITQRQLRWLIRETWESAARPATEEELAYLNTLKGIRMSRQPGHSVENRLDKLESKVDAILDMLGEM